MKTKQQYHERQMSQMTGLLTSKQQTQNVDFNEFSKRCDELLHQARAEITKAFQDSSKGTN